jgi:hypothetical protein
VVCCLRCVVRSVESGAVWCEVRDVSGDLWREVCCVVCCLRCALVCVAWFGVLCCLRCVVCGVLSGVCCLVWFVVRVVM